MWIERQVLVPAETTRFKTSIVKSLLMQISNSISTTSWPISKRSKGIRSLIHKPQAHSISLAQTVALLPKSMAISFSSKNRKKRGLQRKILNSCKGWLLHSLKFLLHRDLTLQRRKDRRFYEWDLKYRKANNFNHIINILQTAMTVVTSIQYSLRILQNIKLLQL